MSETRLQELRSQGAERFDPAGWHYLATLARRAAEHEGNVRRLLEARLAQAAASFAERFAQKRAAAADILGAAREQYPQHAADLECLFIASDFKGLRRLRASLDAGAQGVDLAALVAQLAPAADDGANSRPALGGPPGGELKTVRESRATWARLSVDRQLSKAMQQAPKNAGPINSHMLVLRSLELMQAISPDYLNRMVSYVDTLLSLDPGEKEVPVKRKKAAPAKTARGARAR